MKAHPPSFAVAHVRTKAESALPEYQSVHEHLQAVADLASGFAAKAGLPLSGQLAGMLHDIGKYSISFQHYILSACGIIAPHHANYVDPVQKKGHIDHSTAGSQWLWRHYARNLNNIPLVQLLILGIVSHHSGLVDCISPNKKDYLTQRLSKADEETHLTECLERMDTCFNEALHTLMQSSIMQEIHTATSALRARVAKALPPQASATDIADIKNSQHFQQGLLARFLLSCLIDADRIDCAQFDDPPWATLRAQMPRRPWSELVQRLEKHVSSMPATRKIDHLRGRISAQCARRASDTPGLFSLTVPTGGGKTLASLRFALRHAQAHGLDRIIYIIPYTSIIDQNAQVAREILEDSVAAGSIVLEHHSNIVRADGDCEAEGKAKQWERLAENWDAPVVFTTMVQFLESLFGSGTGHTRRMHNLARSVLVFDEVQTVPVRCLHMFCNALDFLMGSCGSSVVLCTATQPGFNNIPRPLLGSLHLQQQREIINNVAELFADLRRTEFFDHCDNPMDEAAVTALALEELQRSGSCLVICNTKGWADKIYALCGEQFKGARYYLSTNLCPAHRMETFAAMRDRLRAGEPVLCVSTQLIECGVDISFGSVIRLAAGLDSILQAAGRCNRHGGTSKGRVHIVKVDDAVQLQALKDIQHGQRIFFETRALAAQTLAASGGDFTQPNIITSYFERYFYQRGDSLQYAVDNGTRKDTLCNMLGTNNRVRHEDSNKFSQSFQAAAQLFKAIDAPTRSVLVPWGQGADIIADLCSTDIFHQRKYLLRKAQRYSVNIYDTVFKCLLQNNALYSIDEGNISVLHEIFYDKERGLVTTPTGSLRANCL